MRPSCSVSSVARFSGVTSSATSCGLPGTLISSACWARATASAVSSSRLSASALAALAAALSAAALASLAVVSASARAGPDSSTSVFSTAMSGSVIRAKTADLRLPGSRATAVYRFTGSRHRPRTHTVARPPAAVAMTDRARHPARSAGVWVSSATAATMFPSQSGSASTGKAGRSRRALSGTGSSHTGPAISSAASASKPAHRSVSGALMQPSSCLSRGCGAGSGPPARGGSARRRRRGRGRARGVRRHRASPLRGGCPCPGRECRGRGGCRSP